MSCFLVIFHNLSLQTSAQECDASKAAQRTVDCSH